MFSDPFFIVGYNSIRFFIWLSMWEICDSLVLSLKEYVEIGSANKLFKWKMRTLSFLLYSYAGFIKENYHLDICLTTCLTYRKYPFLFSILKNITSTYIGLSEQLLSTLVPLFAEDLIIIKTIKTISMFSLQYRLYICLNIYVFTLEFFSEHLTKCNFRRVVQLIMLAMLWLSTLY